MKFIASSLLVMSLFTGVHANMYDFPDPYPEVYQNVEVLPLNMHGWYRHEDFKPIFATKDLEVVVEVGSWLGNCTIYLAQLLRSPTGKVFAVDHWRGNPENQAAGSYESTLIPTLYQQFLSNIILTGLTDKIVPVRMDSLKAAKAFKKQKIKPDLVYIDASNDYLSVLCDISAWYPLLNQDGILCGDDWNLGDVPRAVRDYADKKGLKVCYNGEFWWYEKP